MCLQPKLNVSGLIYHEEHIPIPVLAKRNVRLGYTPDVLTDAGAQTRQHPTSQLTFVVRHPVADVSILLALMVGRNVGQITSLVSNGDVRVCLPHTVQTI